MELRCTRDLALKLGAMTPETIHRHQMLKNSGLHLLIRDERSLPMFWLLQPEVTGVVRSS